MKILDFEYNYKLEFDQDISDQQFQLRCIPRDGTHQKVLEIDYYIQPVDQVTRLKDGFGNPIYVGSSLKLHNYFSFSVKGKIKVDSQPIIPEGDCYPVYKYNTELTKSSPKIERLAKQFHHLNDEDKCIALMHQVYNDMTYVPGITSIYTCADEAYELKQGVCQDYSHILISALRTTGIPARYVAGMILGEGLTHAWVEAYAGNRWLRLDPTNNKMVDEGYIKLSHGRDFHDCIIDKGMFNGNCKQKQKVSVIVKEI